MDTRRPHSLLDSTVTNRRATVTQAVRACLVALLCGTVCHGVQPGLHSDPSRPVRPPRGVNWGWWRCVEPGDAGAVAEAGGGLLRIAFPYPEIDVDAEGGLTGPGLDYLDSLCRQAEAAGVRFILDCHVPPGGCNPAPWCNDGRNQLWTDTGCQERLRALWTAVARRYRDMSMLYAYELMNEPAPPSEYAVRDYLGLCLRLIDAIRTEDPEHPIVVSGLEWSSPSALTRQIVMARPNLIYTFHLYAPGPLTHYQGGDLHYPGTVKLDRRWLANSPEDWGAEGDLDWHELSVSFTAPRTAREGQVILRSTRNGGSAWFDDVGLLCDGEPVDLGSNCGFAPEAGAAGWHTERETPGEFEPDTEAGAAAPGSLRISGTSDYSGWVCDTVFAASPGAEYTLSCQVRTRAATGSTYPMVAWSTWTDAYVDREWLEQQLEPVLTFREQTGLPILCGEFGCSQALPDDSGLRWVRDVGQMLNRHGLPWTYWNWRETSGPGCMAVWFMQADDYTLNPRLLETLGRLWRE